MLACPTVEGLWNHSSPVSPQLSLLRHPHSPQTESFSQELHINNSLAAWERPTPCKHPGGGGKRISSRLARLVYVRLFSKEIRLACGRESGVHDLVNW